MRLPHGSASGPPLLLLFLLATGCAVNPVTGRQELSLLSTADEISIGESQYRPLQQAGGGQYLVDPAATSTWLQWAGG